MRGHKLTEIYWVAGFLDGEGSFGYNGSPCIQVTSTDRDLIEKCRSYMQVNVGIIETKSDNIDWKDKYKIYVCGHIAIQWMMTLYSLMSLRRKAKIKEVINIWKIASLPNELKTHCPKGHSLSGSNLILELSGSRRCRACKNQSHKSYRARLAKVS